MNETLYLEQRADGMYYPQDDHSSALLRHCSNESFAVTPEHWSSMVKPVVDAHGWAWEIKLLEPR